MKNHILNFLKGICIGIANVIPGFSGGTMAVMVKIYDLFVYAFANIFNDFKNVVKKCWSLFLGILVGILLALVTIVKLLEVIPFITIMFFVGLIIGSIPSIYNKTKGSKVKIVDIVCFILAIAIMVILPFIKTDNDISNSYNFSIYIIMFLMGVICSAAMVIPGVSGSLVLMAFGYYALFMNTFIALLVNLFNFSLTNYWSMFFIIFCFVIGCVVGIVFISKLISKLLEKHPKTVYFTILGLLIASIFSVIYSTFNEYTITLNVPTIIFSIISLSLGIGLVFIGEYFSKKSENK